VTHWLLHVARLYLHYFSGNCVANLCFIPDNSGYPSDYSGNHSYNPSTRRFTDDREGNLLNFLCCVPLTSNSFSTRFSRFCSQEETSYLLDILVNRHWPARPHPLLNGKEGADYSKYTIIFIRLRWSGSSACGGCWGVNQNALILIQWNLDNSNYRISNQKSLSYGKFELRDMLPLGFSHVATAASPLCSSVFQFLAKLTKIWEILF